MKTLRKINGLVIVFHIIIALLLGSCKISQLINYKKHELFETNNKFIHIEATEQPKIDVTFQSGETGRLALDLGAGTTILMQNTGIKHLDTLKPVLAFGKYISADNKKEKITYFKVGNIESEGFSMKNTFLPVIPDIINNPCRNIDGFIGADVFEGKTLVLRFEDATLAVLDSLPETKGWTVVESDYRFPYFYIFIKIGNESIKLLLDTGSSSDIVLSSESFRNIRNNLNPFLRDSSVVFGSSFTTATGIIEDSTYIYNYDLGHLGELPVTTPRIIVSEKMRRNTIGVQTLRRFNIMLDFDAHKVYMQPNLKWRESKNGKGLQEKGLYLRIANNESIIVTSIKMNSIASTKGIQIGDEILSINDISVDQEDKCSVLEKFEAMEWKSHTNVVTVKRNENVLKFEI
ncbi:MAG: PDZ domain-containing protein [Bacteroidales bacterium]|nr:PDZ domain-containing protein [Bacteroidales bacterium]